MKTFTLSRDHCGPDGCFGAMTGEGFTCQIAEHAYQGDDGWAPKVPAGTYRCVRGVHALEDGKPFTTYEILGVAGHSGLLIHPGNLPQVDSKGCLLTGELRGVIEGSPAVINSRQAFAEFLAVCDGDAEISLTVVDRVA